MPFLRVLGMLISRSRKGTSGLRRQSGFLAVLLLLTVACFLSGCSSPSRPDAPKDLPKGRKAEAEKAEVVREFMAKSGLNQQIDSVQELVGFMAAQYPQFQPEAGEKLKEFDDIFKQALDPKIFKDRLGARIQEKIDLEDLRVMLKWLDTPLGRKVTQMEEAAAQPQAHAEMSGMASRLMQEAQGTPREERIARIDRATRSSESVMKMLKDMQVEMISAVIVRTPKEKRPSQETLHQILSGSASMIDQLIPASVQASMLYTYRGLSDEELDQYIQMLESDIGRRCYLTVTESLAEMFVGVAREIGIRIVSKGKGI